METWTVRNHQTDLFSHRPQLVMQQQKMTWETASPSSVKTVLACFWSGQHQAKPSLLRSRAYHAATGVPASMVGCSWLPKYLYLDVHLCKYICLKHSIYRLFYTDVNLEVKLWCANHVIFSYNVPYHWTVNGKEILPFWKSPIHKKCKHDCFAIKFSLQFGCMLDVLRRDDSGPWWKRKDDG